jgi:transmembrane sensor
LAGGSHLTVDARNEEMKLAGTAWFDVPHDPSRTLTIAAGPYRITDIGTKFDISTDIGTMKVAVAEGSLSVKEGGLTAPVDLKEGQHLLASQTLGIAEVSTVSTENVGSWRSGRLVYQAVPLSLVAAEISRYAGKKVIADRSIAGRRFSGVLSIGDGSALVSNLAQFANLKQISGDAGVRLVDGNSH